MKTTTIKIEDTIINAAMKRGGFSRPEDAVKYALRIVFDAPEKEKTVPKRKHTKFVESITGIMKYDPAISDKELLADALAEKCSK